MARDLLFETHEIGTKPVQLKITATLAEAVKLLESEGNKIFMLSSVGHDGLKTATVTLVPGRGVCGVADTLSS